MNAAEIRYLMMMLSDRLAECEAGLWVDPDFESEVAMVRSLLRRLKKMEQTEAIPF